MELHDISDDRGVSPNFEPALAAKFGRHWGSFRSAAAKRCSGGAVKKKFGYFLTTEMRSGAA